MVKSKGRKMGGPWRRIASARSIREERRSATTMTCVSLSCRFMFWALKTRARLPHKNTLTSDDEAGSAADTAAERLAPAQVTPSPQSLARMVNILPSFPCCLKKTLHPTGLLCGEIVGKTIEDRWLTAVCGGKRAILYSVSVSRGRLHFFKRSAQPFLCHVFQEVDSDIQSTPGPGHTLNSGKFAGGKNKEKAEMIFSIFRCFVWK